MKLTPDTGTRYLLERVGESADRASARYAATAVSPDGEWTFDVTLHAAGDPAIAPRGTPPPDPAIAAQLAAIARQVARQAARNRAEGLAIVWPRRVLRWKGPGRGA